jgi:hypothetical protein
MFETAELWKFLPIGYALSVLLETPVLVVGLSKRHPIGRRVFAGFWLTAGTYPIVVLVLPLLFESYWMYLLTAEIFAPAGECAMFWAAFWSGSESRKQKEVRRDLGQDMLAIVAANLCSFVIGGLILQALWVS